MVDMVITVAFACLWLFCLTEDPLRMFAGMYGRRDRNRAQGQDEWWNTMLRKRTDPFYCSYRYCTVIKWREWFRITGTTGEKFQVFSISSKNQGAEKLRIRNTFICSCNLRIFTRIDKNSITLAVHWEKNQTRYVIIEGSISELLHVTMWRNSTYRLPNLTLAPKLIWKSRSLVS